MAEGAVRNRRAVAVFVVVAFGLAWVVTLPLWLSGRGLQTPGALVVLLTMMLTPSVATLVVSWRSRSGLALRTGLRSPGGIRSWLGWGVVAWFGPLLATALAMLISVVAGTLPLAPTGPSTFTGGLVDLDLPVGTVAVLQLVTLPLVGWLNVIPALGEEWGWRGWLLPQLLPLGRWWASLAVGVVWGLWHAPVILLGQNYPVQTPVVALLLMVVFCVLLGALLNELRLSSGSVWPPAIAHGFVNAWAVVPLLFAPAGAPVDTATAGLLGWPGWIVLAALLAVVVLTGRGRAPAGRLDGVSRGPSV